MKKHLILGSIILVAIMLVGCSSEEKQVEATQEELKSSYEKYDAHLKEQIGVANGLLETYSNALDSIYTGTMSSSQFSNVLKNDIIDNSGVLVDASESYDVHPTIFELNQRFTSYVNEQHQLFLDTIDTANEDKLNKDKLRKRLVELKETQSSIINTWKQT